MALLKPQTVRVQDVDGDAEPEVAAVIDLEEFQDARRDPAWRDFREEALAYRQRLIADGRSS